ncbi:ATP-binding protein [Kitasatospora azatica]|uniref:ATP-binding protein n=1 Tax=Kitasatospora azatica TaxID=58347 RepID=UPI0018DB7791|nr:ATP-binding protein [Kitasatospora azatica]
MITPDRPGGGTHAGENFVVTFAAHPDRVGQIRHMLRAILRYRRLEHLTADAELVASELVTNAIQHAPDQRPITITVDLDEQWLSLAVRDHSADWPRPAEPVPSQENGRGLLLVGRLAGSWHCAAHTDGGKTVSCRLPVSDPSPARRLLPRRQHTPPLEADGSGARQSASDRPPSQDASLSQS